MHEPKWYKLNTVSNALVLEIVSIPFLGCPRCAHDVHSACSRVSECAASSLCVYVCASEHAYLFP